MKKGEDVGCVVPRLKVSTTNKDIKAAEVVWSPGREAKGRSSASGSASEAKNRQDIETEAKDGAVGYLVT